MMMNLGLLLLSLAGAAETAPVMLRVQGIETLLIAPDRPATIRWRAASPAQRKRRPAANRRWANHPGNSPAKTGPATQASKPAPLKTPARKAGPCRRIWEPALFPTRPS